MNRFSSVFMIAVQTIMTLTAGQDCARPFDQEFWKFQNMLRTNPKDFIPFLEDWLARFEGDTKIYKDVQGNQITTTDGKPAVQGLIDFLKLQEAISPLNWADPLAYAAIALAQPQGQAKEKGSTGPNGSTLTTRLEKCAPGWGDHKKGENLFYGSATPLEAVLRIAIQDGEDASGQRNNIFNKDYHYVGLATEPHGNY